MLRDEPEAALDDAIVALKNAADSYTDAAGLVGDSDRGLSAQLIAMAARRRAMATALEAHLRRMGELPSDPDAEAEAIEQVVRHVAAALTADEPARIRDEVASREADLRTALESALAAGPPPEAADLTRSFLAEIDAEAAS